MGIFQLDGSKQTKADKEQTEHQVPALQCGHKGKVQPEKFCKVEVSGQIDVDHAQIHPEKVAQEGESGVEIGGAENHPGQIDEGKGAQKAEGRVKFFQRFFKNSLHDLSQPVEKSP